MWITRVALNEAYQFHRKAKRLPLVHDSSELPELTSPSESPLQACVRAELTEKLKAAVERLPLKYKQVLILDNLQELSLQETAQELQTTTSAVKTQIFRAKAALSKALLREFGGLTSQRTFTPKRRACPPEDAFLLCDVNPSRELTEIRQLPTIVAS